MFGFPEHSLCVIHMLIDLGFDSEREISIQGIKMKPLDFTLSILKHIPIPKGYNEFEDIWVRSEGMKDGKKKTVNMECIVKTIDGWEDAGSNIDTGRTIAVMSEMIHQKQIKAIGVRAPEGVVPHQRFFKELEKRGMRIYENGEKFNYR